MFKQTLLLLRTCCSASVGHNCVNYSRPMLRTEVDYNMHCLETSSSHVFNYSLCGEREILLWWCSDNYRNVFADYLSPIVICVFSVIDEQNEQTLRNKLRAQSEDEDVPAKVPISFTDSNESSTLQSSESFSSKSSTVPSTTSNNLETQRLSWLFVGISQCLNSAVWYSSFSQRSSIVSNIDNTTLSPPVAHFPKLSPKVKVKGTKDVATFLSYLLWNHYET